MLLVLSVACLLSVVRWLKYVPIYIYDSSEYLGLGHAIARGRFFAVDNGFRTPLFALYLALTGNRPRVAFAGHLVFGVVVCFLLYRIFRGLSGRAEVGAAAALLYILSPATPYFQASISTETLAAVCVAVGAYFSMQSSRSPARFVRNVVLASLAFSLASLDRPEYGLLSPLIVMLMVALALPRRDSSFSWRRAACPALAGLAPWVVLVLGWSSVNYVRFGWFTLSTLTGYHLTQYSGPYLNEVPPPDKALADAFYQEEQAYVRAHHGRHIDAFWDARPHLLAASGLTDAQLSRAFVRISLRLILAHPKAYLSAVWWSWKVFWRPPLYSRGLNLTDLRRALEAVFGGQISWWHRLYAYLYLPVELAYAAALLGPLVRRRWWPVLWSPGMLSLSTIILYTSVITSLVEPEDNYRFKVPVEGLIFGVAVTAACLIANDLRGRHGRRIRGPEADA
jgi:hypothetical protein